MSKIKNPIRFSDCFCIDSALLDRAGILNPTLNADTRLFIDPLLLEKSRHPEMSGEARTTYTEYFGRTITLLREIKVEGDTYWRNARKLLSFPELKGTCLGYGAESIAGSGSGDETTNQIFKTAREIVALGIRDPDLFVAMALFEENFGPDRISDMVTNIIFGELLKLNARVLSRFNLPTEQFRMHLKNGTIHSALLPRNPFANGDVPVPVILVPTDVLRDLPVASDWEDVSRAASESAIIRSRVNDQIAQLWRSKTLKDKQAMRTWALSDKYSFETLLKMVQAVKPSPYDVIGDPNGEIFWRQLLIDIAKEDPFTVRKPKQFDIDGVTSVVQQILQQFQFLVEKRRLSSELYYDGQPRPERSAQRLFFAVAYSYCKANDLDITPEADTGTGPVDFKVASGFNGRVLVELKLSTNNKLLRGYQRQLETYKKAEETHRGFYVVIDVGGNTSKKKKSLMEMRSVAMARSEGASELVFIDALLRPSASKR